MVRANAEQIPGTTPDPEAFPDFQELFSTSQRLTEWVDGKLNYMPSPSTAHQLILKLFMSLLDTVVSHFELGLVMFNPFEVRMWSDGPARQPDICLITSDQLRHLSADRFSGPPAMVVEVMSRGSVREDQVQKFSEYEGAGVKEYWLIDARPDYRIINLFVRNEAGFFENIEPVNHYLQSSVVPHFGFDTRWIRSGPIVKEQKALAQIMLKIPNLPPEMKAYYQFLASP